MFRSNELHITGHGTHTRTRPKPTSAHASMVANNSNERISPFRTITETVWLRFPPTRESGAVHIRTKVCTNVGQHPEASGDFLDPARGVTEHRTERTRTKEPKKERIEHHRLRELLQQLGFCKSVTSSTPRKTQAGGIGAATHHPASTGSLGETRRVLGRLCNLRQFETKRPASTFILSSF